jgi:hypothetical protein
MKRELGIAEGRANIDSEKWQKLWGKGSPECKGTVSHSKSSPMELFFWLLTIKQLRWVQKGISKGHLIFLIPQLRKNIILNCKDLLLNEIN